MEVWRNVTGYDGVYQVSNLGRVRSYRKGRWGMSAKPRLLRQFVQSRRYLGVKLCIGGTKQTHCVHSLVAAEFIGVRPVGHDIRHLDGDGFNNKEENLQYGSRLENMEDMKRHRRTTYGERSASAKLTGNEVKEIRAMYKTGDYRLKDIADIFGVGKVTVFDVIKGKTWRHIDE